MKPEKPKKSFVEYIKSSIFGWETLSFSYHPVIDGIQPADQGGFILTRAEFEELCKHIYTFYDSVSDDEINEHNQAVYERMFHSPSPKTKQLDRPTAQRQGFIYLIKSGRYYKIGQTTKLKDRLASLQIQLPEPFELVHTIKVADVDAKERWLHQLFSEKRLNGEWFALDDADVTYICSLQHEIE